LPPPVGSARETGRVDRRAFLLGTGAVLLAGCATAVPGEQQPTPTLSAAPAGVVIGVEQSSVGTILGALLVGAAQQAGVSASAQPWGTDWRAALGAGTLAAAPVWAASVWADLSDDDEQPTDLLADLAGLLEPDVSVLAPGATDGGLVWLTAATSGVKSLDGLSKWAVGKQAAVSSMAIERADGLGALNAIYRTNFAALVQEDPVARAQLVASGQAPIGAFRRTENTGGAALVELADPDKMGIADPLVLLANTTLTDQRPDLVLALTGVVQKLTNADLIALHQQLVQGAQVDGIAQAWLVSKGLA
jgi:glycine betaine/choline ABC-type transport system substrate-binding protein